MEITPEKALNDIMGKLRELKENLNHQWVFTSPMDEEIRIRWGWWEPLEDIYSLFYKQWVVVVGGKEHKIDMNDEEFAEYVWQKFFQL
jgi:hypothetical protein